MKAILQFILVSILFMGLFYNTKDATGAENPSARFIILNEFYMLKGDSTKTKLIKNKTTNECFLLKHVYYRRPAGAGKGEYLSPASCRTTSTFITLNEFYMLKGDSTKTRLIKNKTTNECFLLKHAYYRRSGDAGKGEYLSASSCAI